MKKLPALLLCISILFCICGCKKEKTALIAPVAFYYRTTEFCYDGTTHVIGSEQRESAGFNDNMQLLLNAYFNGPISEDLTSPFPRSLKAISYSVFGTTAIVEVSSVISQIKGIDVSIACACIASTVLELNDKIERVQIRSGGPYLDGSNSITITRSHFLLSDTTSEPLTSEVETTTNSP